MKDYYLILGLPKTATTAEIDSAFRKLARKYHPDVQPEEEDSLARFKAAKEAHDVLSNAEKRREYDRKRSQGERRHALKPSDPSRRTRHEFQNLWRGGTKIPRESAGESEAAPRTSPDMEAELRLVPEEANHGGPCEVRITVRQTCFACNGQAVAAGESCAVCGGEGTVRGSRLLQLQLPPRLRDGTVLRIAGRGAAVDPNAPCGDLYLVIRVRPCW